MREEELSSRQQSTPLQNNRNAALVLSLTRVTRLPRERKMIVETQLENRGSGVASNVVVGLLFKPDYKVEDWQSTDRRLGTLTPQTRQTLEFTIFPQDLTVSSISVGIQVTYEEGTRQKITHFALDVPLAPPRRAFAPIENPYVAGPPLDPRRSKKVFFGREHTFDLIIKDLRGKFQQNILVLHGERRTGKTSLLLQLGYNRLKPPFYAVLLDMQGFVDAGTGPLLYQMARQISGTLLNCGIPVGTPQRHTFLEGRFGAFSQFLDSVESHLADGYLVLMIDEFEELEKRVQDQKVDEDIFAYLRSQMQHRRSLIFVFAGTHKLEELSKDYFSIFFNAAIYHEISLLEKREAESLIVEPIAPIVAYEPAAVDQIISATNCHPYFIQLICYHMVNLLNKEETNVVTPKLVDTVIREIVESEVGHLDYLWNHSDESEQLILAAITELHRSLPMVRHFRYDEIAREVEFHAKNLPKEKLDQAIQSLHRRRLIQHPPQRETDWGISLPLLSHWIREKQPQIFFHRNQ